METGDDILFDSLLPIFAICRSIGMFAVRISRHGMRKRKLDLLYFTLYFVGYFLIFYGISIDFPDEKALDVVPIAVIIVWIACSLVLMQIVLITCYIFRGLIISAFASLGRIDAALRCLDIRMTSTRPNNVRFLAVLICSITLRSSLTIGICPLTFLQMLGTFMVTFLKTISKYQFILFLLPVQKRFGKVNEAIGKLSKSDESNEQRRLRLRKLVRLHYKLCDVSKSLGVACAFTLLLSFGVSVVDILEQAFYLYILATHKSHVATFSKVGSPVCWLMDETLEMFLLVQACHNTVTEANSTPSLLHKLSYDVDDETRRDIKSYSIEMMHQRMIFDVAGFFIIDFEMFYQFFNAVATYLIISIQSYEKMVQLQSQQANTEPPLSTPSL